MNHYKTNETHKLQEKKSNDQFSHKFNQHVLRKNETPRSKQRWKYDIKNDKSAVSVNDVHIK